MRAVRATTVVCLNHRRELEDRYPQYVEWLHMQQSDRLVWTPIPDLSAPPVAVAVVLVDDLCQRLQRGETLLVHCGAGIGRAGTIAVGVLMQMGVPLKAALVTVAESRPMAGPEAGAQRELLLSLSNADPGD